MNKRKGSAFICIGLLLLAAALALTVYNMQTEMSAGKSSQQVLAQLRGLSAAGVDAALPGHTPAPGEAFTPAYPTSAEPAASPEVMPTFVPDYRLFPEMEMPVVTVEEHDYIGTLRIPDLGLELPVMSEWSYPKLKLAPCRFTGTAYKGDLIIVAHNYVTHLGNIKNLPAGAEVTFTDVAGNVFCYTLAEIEILKPNQVEDLMGTDYPLTLVTCTVGGRTRVTARCVLVGEIPFVPGE